MTELELLGTTKLPNMANTLLHSIEAWDSLGIGDNYKQKKKEQKKLIQNHVSFSSVRITQVKVLTLVKQVASICSASVHRQDLISLPRYELTVPCLLDF